MKPRKIISNKIQCTHCGDIIESKSVHNFVSCSCGAVSVDGGRDYCRRSFRNSPKDYIELSEWADALGEGDSGVDGPKEECPIV